MRRLLDWLFSFEPINGDGAAEAYLHRWTLMKLWGGRALYLHHFIGDDWARDFHDHPKAFTSIMLWGSYEELTPAWMAPGLENLTPETDCGAVASRTYTAPCIRRFPATHRHRIKLTKPGAYCWTLVYVGRNERPWGFWRGGRWEPWRSYVQREGGRRGEVRDNGIAHAQRNRRGRGQHARRGGG